MWRFPNGNSVWTSCLYTGDDARERCYVVIVNRVQVAEYPPTDIGWCDAMVHAARGEPI